MGRWSGRLPLEVVPVIRYGNGTTKVLLAILALHERGAHITIRAVAEEAGTSVSRAHFHLNRLRSEGLVGWEDRTHGTLRPTARRVA
jgi:DNA-binding IclR family transcriptional regulator